MMFKTILLSIALSIVAVACLAGAAHAQQIPSVDALCARPDLRVDQKIFCSSPRLRANGQRNLNALVPLATASKLSQAEIMAMLQTAMKQSNEHMSYCGVPADRMPPLPLAKANEDCLAGWQDVAYANYQRGILPEHNPQAVSTSGLTAEQQQQVAGKQQAMYSAYQAHERTAARCRLLANNSGRGGWFAFGTPAFVGLSAIANTIGEAARASNNYRDCMLAQGQQP